MPVVFQMGEDSRDGSRGQVGQLDLRWLLVSISTQVAKQQPKRISIGGNGAWACVALVDEMSAPLFRLRQPSSATGTLRLKRRAWRASLKPIVRSVSCLSVYAKDDKRN